MIKRLILPALIFFTLMSCGGNSHSGSSADAADSEDSVITVTTEQKSANSAETRTDKSAGMPVIIDFWADWCNPCMEMKPIFVKLEHEYAGRADFRSLDVDDESTLELKEKYQISAIPTFIFLNSKGEEVSRIVGMVDESELRESIEAVALKKPEQLNNN